MPSFAAQLTDQQVADIANYVRTSWGNGAPSNATPQAVAAVRRPMPGGAKASPPPAK
jgi:mono/diheme cytochrome c family protein